MAERGNEVNTYDAAERVLLLHSGIASLQATDDT